MGISQCGAMNNIGGFGRLIDDTVEDLPVQNAEGVGPVFTNLMK
jgi:hypothetical protein